MATAARSFTLIRNDSPEPSSYPTSAGFAVADLREAARQRAAADRAIVDAVAAARQLGVDWDAIGEIVGTDGDDAQHRYGAIVTRVSLDAWARHPAFRAP